MAAPSEPYGGYAKLANQKEHHRDRRYGRNQSGQRRVIAVYVSEAAIPSPQFSIRKSQAASFIRARREGNGSARRRSGIMG